MSTRIFRNIVLTAILAILLTAALTVLNMYSVYEDGMSGELAREADYIRRALQLTEDDLTYVQGLDTDNRITLISADGTVRYDSVVDADQMENHAQRPEILQALSEGRGESTRTSDTLSEVTIYYALQLEDGSVLRLASTRSSIWGAFMEVLPLTACMLLIVVLLSLAMARRTARRIVAPINSLNLDKPLENEVYDELAPLLTRMESQHEEIRRHMASLENATTNLTAIMENMREGLVMLDAGENILSINESAANVFGVEAGDVLGKNMLAANRSADLHDLIRQALKGKAGDILLTHTQRSYQIYASPVLNRNTVRGVVLLILDVSERYAAEASRREFTANVSHELKTPLTSISGYAEIIRDGIAQPRDVPVFAGKIYAESGRLIALVNDILQLSRLDERQGLGAKTSVPLRETLEKLMENFSLPARNKNLAFTLQGDEVSIQGYPVLIQEMFYNLIDNAIKYTPEGRRVEVSIAEHDGLCECSVSDNGIGIPPEHQAHIFERFYRVDKSHSRATGGTGLGLAIVKHAAEIHGARLKLKSSPGEGTTVTVCFETE